MRHEFQALLDRTRNQEKLILEFVSVFARFEFSLIKTGYVRDRHDEIVEPAWWAFADALPVVLVEAPDYDVREAVAYLYRWPPRRLRKTHNDVIEWHTQKPKRSNSAILQLVKDVRNNLLHGGKVPPLRGDRDARLLKSSLIILSFVLDFDQRVHDAICFEPIWVAA